MTETLIGQKKKPEAKHKKKPEDVFIESITAVVLPGAIQGSLIVLVLGNGTDERVYQYDNEKKEWFEQ